VLSFGLCYIAVVTGSGVILGITGGFGPIGFLISHVGVASVLLWLRRSALPSDAAQLRHALNGFKRFFTQSGSDRFIGAGLLLVLAALTIVAGLAHPAIVDAQAYHLPRLAHWLQDGRIQMIGSADERINYVAVLPEIMMAWLLGPTREGFSFVVLAQAFGGLLAVGATVGIARLTGLARSGSLLAGGLLLGMANVAVQFTAAQTDLFTTGIFAAAVYLWLVKIRRSDAPLLGSAGCGIALAAKGTLFYMAPTAIIWAAWTAYRHPISKVRWCYTLVATTIGVGAFALPGFVRNWYAYGSALGPAAWVKKHHQGFDSVAGQLDKLYWNFTTELAQNLDPWSQPSGLRRLSRMAVEAVSKRLPETDAYTYPGMNRKLTLQTMLTLGRPDPDVTGFGAVALLLFITGTIVAIIRWRSAETGLLLVWSGGVILFLVFFNGMQQWHPYAFRYLVLASPWIAIIGAWGIEQLPQLPRALVWLLVAAATLNVAWCVTLRSGHSGWQTVVHPERAPEYLLARLWRDWSENLDRNSGDLTLVLNWGQPIVAFYRQWPPRTIRYRALPPAGTSTAEAYLNGQDGWVIAPASTFMGREGRVAAQVWLANGDGEDPRSLAAYRTLGPREVLRPIIYRNTHAKNGIKLVYSIRVSTGDRDLIELRLPGLGKSPFRYEVTSPVGHNESRVASGSSQIIAISVRPHSLDDLTIAGFGHPMVLLFAG